MIVYCVRTSEGWKPDDFWGFDVLGAFWNEAMIGPYEYNLVPSADNSFPDSPGCYCTVEYSRWGYLMTSNRFVKLHDYL